MFFASLGSSQGSHATFTLNSPLFFFFRLSWTEQSERRACLVGKVSCWRPPRAKCVFFAHCASQNYEGKTQEQNFLYCKDSSREESFFVVAEKCCLGGAARVVFKPCLALVAPRALATIAAEISRRASKAGFGLNTTGAPELGFTSRMQNEVCHCR